MKQITFLLIAVATLAVVVAYIVPASGQTGGDVAPIYGVKIPAGYRDWRMISVANVGEPVNDLRVKLGNDLAMKAYREGTPFPDGAMIARLAYRAVTSEENNKVFRIAAEKQGLSPDQITKLLAGSFIAGPATNVQFMVKDSTKYGSTGGWGFAEFTDGKPSSEAVHKTCFVCHAPAKDNDFVFTRFSL
jgi:hypothetical protein